MSTNDRPAPRGPDPASFLAAEAALEVIEEALREARSPRGEGRPEPAGPASPGLDQALAALLLLREVRGRLADWETTLIESARAAGASWGDLAAPLGVASRQAAERRYLRGRPGGPGTTGEQRVQATRDRRAADRTVAAWAREHAGDLRQLAGQVAALGDLPSAPRALLTDALGHDDPAHLLAPLAGARPHLSGHPDLADRIETLAAHTGRLRQDSDHARRPGT